MFKNNKKSKEVYSRWGLFSFDTGDKTLSFHVAYLESKETIFRITFSYLDIISIGNHTVFLVQFGINLHEWVFQKAEIAPAASASAISAFWKTHKCKLIPNWTRKTVWLLINNINKKIRVEEVPEDLSWSHFFSFEKTFFKVSAKNFIIILCDIIGIENFLLSLSQS